MALPVPWCLPRRFHYFPEPLRGGGDPRHLRGERALRPPRRARLPEFTVPRSFTRYGRVTLAHKAIACSGISASAAASPSRASCLTGRVTLAHKAIACSGLFVAPTTIPFLHLIPYVSACHVTTMCQVLAGAHSATPRSYPSSMPMRLILPYSKRLSPPNRKKSRRNTGA